MVPRVKVDALVLLGCRVDGHGGLSGAARRRVERTASAYRELGGRLVIASGGRRWGGVVEADALARALVALGVAERDIVRERESLTTRENARYSAHLLREKGLSEVGVVTCDWHLARAIECFRREGINATGLAAPSPPVAPLARRVRALRERLAQTLEGRVASAVTRAWRSR
jgi:uncharacterized SAM-binding protein YcdF (DUF218 family)